jgi:predicted alpha/beta-fold hydrolase
MRGNTTFVVPLHSSLKWLSLALLLAGCSKSVSTTPEGWVSVSNGDGSAAVKEVTMPSGLRCVVLVGYSKGALTCDWR